MDVQQQRIVVYVYELVADEVDEMLARQYNQLKEVVGAIDAEQSTTVDDIERLGRLATELRSDRAHSAEVLLRDRQCLRIRQDFRD